MCEIHLAKPLGPYSNSSFSTQRDRVGSGGSRRWEIRCLLFGCIFLVIVATSLAWVVFVHRCGDAMNLVVIVVVLLDRARGSDISWFHAWQCAGHVGQCVMTGGVGLVEGAWLDVLVLEGEEDLSGRKTLYGSARLAMAHIGVFFFLKVSTQFLCFPLLLGGKP